jgi:hypothetical protein
MDELSLHELFQMEMAQLREEHGREPDPDSWRWSPFDIRKFDPMLKIADDYCTSQDGYDRLSNPVTFWEAGSGIGTKLFLAKHKYDMTEYGLEINDDYLVKARRLGVRCDKCDLSNLDDQPMWEAADIVYTARPFKDEIKESRWELLVQESMRPGAVLISTFAAVKPYRWTCLYKGPYRGVWVKPSGQGPRPVGQSEYAEEVFA